MPEDCQCKNNFITEIKSVIRFSCICTSVIEATTGYYVVNHGKRFRCITCLFFKSGVNILEP